MNRVFHGPVRAPGDDGIESDYREQTVQLKADIKHWQERADATDFDDEGGSKYDEVALKALIDEARTLLLRANLSL